MSKFFPLTINVLIVVSLAVTGCGEIPPNPCALIATGTLAPTPSALPASAATIPTPTFIPDTGWNQVCPGLEQRIINLFDENGQRVEYLYVLRLEPEYFQFDVAYHPQPQTLEAWQAETDALIIVNGGFFRKENESYLPNGLTVINGQVLGSSYEGFGGMFAITDHGPELRWLAQRPYDPAERLRGALQAFPMLVKPGGELGFPKELEDSRQARRTVIGQDMSGRILLIVAPLGYFTLHQLSLYLTTSDLVLDIALNLDGGASSGLLLSNPRYEIAAYTLLPIVITVQER